MPASINRSSGGTICAPSAVYTLYPLSAGGLCDAVTWMPATAPSARTWNAVMGVGSGPGMTRTTNPAAESTSATAAANSTDPCRASRPTITVPPACPLCFNHSATP